MFSDNYRCGVKRKLPITVLFGMLVQITLKRSYTNTTTDTNKLINISLINTLINKCLDDLSEDLIFMKLFLEVI